MKLSVASPGVKSSNAPFSLTSRGATRVRDGTRSRLVQTKIRVLQLDAVELAKQRDTVDDDRLLVEVAYARSKVRHVHALNDFAEVQLQELLAVLTQPKTRKKPTQPPPQEIRVHKQMDWGEATDIFVPTTREGNVHKDKKRTTKTLPIASEFEHITSSPFQRNMQTRLLTADEEKELAVKIQRLVTVDSLRDHFQQVHGRFPTWSETGKMLQVDPVELQKECRAGQEAKQTMIARNMRLVISIAAKLRPAEMQMHDLIVDGATGLIRAIEKFDPEKGYKLSTYAHWWIRQSIIRAMSDRNRVVKVPSNVADEFQRLIRTRDRLTAKNGVVPPDAELAKKLGLTEKRLYAIKNAYKTAVSLDAKFPGADRDADTRGDLIEDPKTVSAEENYMNKMMRQDLDLVLSTLPEKEATIVRLRYGLEDGHERTLEDVGHLFHVTRERVRQIEAKALRKLRQRSGTLKEYLEPVQKTVYRSTAASSLKSS